MRPVIEETMNRKFGSDWAKQIAAKIRSKMSPEKCKKRAQKAKQTVIERYGVNSAVQLPHVRKRCLNARLQPDVVTKQQATCLERFGVKSLLSLRRVRMLANTPEKCHQRHLTMKKNNSYSSSKQELMFYEWLVKNRNVDDVERQVFVNRWPIDFYIKSIDTYVQFDGEYWHGIDRSLEEIAKFKTPRDKIILRKYQIDREQDEWFKCSGMHLLRITNKQFARGDVPDALK